MIYKTFQKVSNVCQVLDKSKYYKTQTINGVTLTNNGDGTYTVNGTATNDVYYTIIPLRDTLYLSHQYLLTGENSGLYLFVENRDKDNKLLPQLRHNIIRSLPTNTKKSTFECYIEQGTVCDNLVFKPQLFDLTEMYGAGNEPTTVEQFRQDFPEEMYDYSPHCFVKSYKTLLKASDVCQLMDKSKYTGTRTINGVTFTNNGDGSITVNGTATARAIFNIQISNYFPSNLIGHTCLIVPNVSLPTTTNTINIHTTSWEVSNIKPIGKIDIMPDVRISVFPGYTANNLVFKPQLFDLTETYGAGNEPTTVEQFRQDFPEEMYDYKPYSTIPSYKKSLVCKTKNLFDNIPVKTNYIINSNGEEVASPGYNIYGKMYGNNFTISTNAPVDLNGSDNWLRVCLYNSEGIFITRKDFDFNKRTVANIADDNIAYIQLCFHRSSFPNYKLQVEYGTTPTEYHPYGYL